MRADKPGETTLRFCARRFLVAFHSIEPSEDSVPSSSFPRKPECQRNGRERIEASITP